MSEEWKSIKDYEGLYEISNLGNVKSLIKNRLLKPWMHKKGYMVVTLTKAKKHKHFFVHRLVASAFLESKELTTEVNHIDGNKHNNCAENLEWCGDFENREHAYNTKLRKMEVFIKVKAYSINGDFIREFSSISEASRETSTNIGNISRCINGGCKTAGGYVWKRSGAE